MIVEGIEGYTEQTAAAEAAALRRRNPLTHCLTNHVAIELTANLLLAAGASPAMVVAEEEAGAFAAVADALLINVGTVTAPDADAMAAAVAGAHEAGTPWVLDPVAAGVLALRTRVVGELLGRGPAIVRGNASEILAVAGAGSGGRGVDATAGPEEALEAAHALSERTGAVVAVSGAVDHIVEGRRLVRVHGGDPLLTAVTGAGCALGALMAAHLAIADPLRAAVGASAAMACAAEAAARGARGPASFATALLDELWALGGGR